MCITMNALLLTSSKRRCGGLVSDSGARWAYDAPTGHALYCTATDDYDTCRRTWAELVRVDCA